VALAVAMILCLAAKTRSAEFRGFCSETAFTLYAACNADRTEEAAVQKAVCNNLAGAERRECFAARDEWLDEARALCPAQRDGRLSACKKLGEARYDPDFSPSRFDDPKSPSKPNPYFPMQVGNKWEFLGGDERNTVEVVDETKRMPSGVDCLVFRDLVFTNGELTEATDDWFVPAKDGTVWYCGEEVTNLESFEGDMPRRPELVSIDGSFKAGRDGAKAGIIFLGSPAQGDAYLEEFSLANAEDIAEVLTIKYSFGKSADLDRLVPKALAELLCHDDCVVTKNVSLLEPGIVERKYYARGIGVFLETTLDTNEVLQLVSCNVDPRCANLPTP
jgi:hypothetical protein